jgi:Cytochrome b5-like Heme/Steroid binding domain
MCLTDPLPTIKRGGVGGPYNVLAGREVARALAKMALKEEECHARLDDLGDQELQVLKDWEEKLSAKYSVVGRVRWMCDNAHSSAHSLKPVCGWLPERIAGGAQAINKQIWNGRQVVPLEELTLEELAKHDGSNPEKPIYLAIRGTVFDVTTGNQYGLGCQIAAQCSIIVVLTDYYCLVFFQD